MNMGNSKRDIKNKEKHPDQSDECAHDTLDSEQTVALNKTYQAPKIERLGKIAVVTCKTIFTG